MKFKFNYKLTISLVSLFIGFILFIFGNENKYCLFFGFIFFAIGLIMLAVDRTRKIDKRRIEIDNQLYSDEELKDELLTELNNESYRLNRQKKRINITSYACAILFVVVAIFVLI